MELKLNLDSSLDSILPMTGYNNAVFKVTSQTFV